MNIEVKEKYKDYLNTREGVNNYHKFKKILYGTSDSLLLRLAESLIPKIKSKKIDILDVGGGDGERVMHLMSLMKMNGIESTCELVEPSKVFIQDLQESLKINNEGHIIHIYNSLFEDYSSDKKFDIILFIHSIYTFKDDKYIHKMKDLLKPNGLAVFVTNDEKSFLWKLKVISDSSFGTQRNEITSLVPSLKKNGFKIIEERSLTSFSNCLENEELNEDGKLAVKWIALRDYNDIPPDIIDSARSLFLESNKGGIIQDTEVFIFASL